MSACFLRKHRAHSQNSQRPTKKNKPKLADKIEVAHRYIEQGHCIAFVLRVVEIERSSYYAHVNKVEIKSILRAGRPAPGLSYTVEGKRVSDEERCEWIMEFVAGEGAAYGYRKLTVLLRRRHELVINKKKVYRLCKLMMILRSQRKLKMKHPRILANNRIITASNQLWERILSMVGLLASSVSSSLCAL